MTLFCCTEDELISYSNWDIDEPDKTKNRDCAAFGYATDFKWVGAICDEFPSGFLVVCQYGELVVQISYLSH